MRKILFSAVLAMVTPAWAGPYGIIQGLSTGYPDYDNVEDGSGEQFTLGYRFAGKPWRLEVSRVEWSDADITSSSGASLSFSGMTVGLGYHLGNRNYRHEGTGFAIAAGYYTGDARIAGPAGFLEDSASGFSLDLRGTWMFSEHIGLNAGLQTFFDMKDFSADRDAQSLKLGLTVEFPSKKSAPAKPAEPAPAAEAQSLAPAETTPEPVATEPAAQTNPEPAAETLSPAALEPAAEPAPAPALEPVPPLAIERPQPITPPAPAAPAPARGSLQTEALPDFAAAPTALVPEPGALEVYTRPTTTGRLLANLPATPAPRILDTLSNEHGVWCFVESGRVRGWVRQDQLQK